MLQIKDIRFRSGHASDALAIEELRDISAFGTEAGTDLTGKSSRGPGLLSLLRAEGFIQPQSPVQRCVVAASGDKLIGLIATIPMGRTTRLGAANQGNAVLRLYADLIPAEGLLISALAVQFAYRRLGIAHRLLRITNREAQAIGAEKVSIILSDRHVGARRCLLRAGFAPVRVARLPHGALPEAGKSLDLLEHSLRPPGTRAGQPHSNTAPED